MLSERCLPKAFRPLTPPLPSQLPDAADTRQIFVKLGEKEPYLVIFHLNYLLSHCPRAVPRQTSPSHSPTQEPLRAPDPGSSLQGLSLPSWEKGMGLSLS